VTLMFRGAVMIMAVLSLGVAACGDDTSASTTTRSALPASTPSTASVAASSSTLPSTASVPTTTSTSSSALVEVTVSGVVLAVEGTLAGTDYFTIRLEDGSDLTLVPVDGLLFDGVSPLSHVRDHLVSGSPVQVTYQTSVAGPGTAIKIGDAGGGEHSHDD